MDQKGCIIIQITWGGGQVELGLNIQQVIKKKQNKNSFSLGGKKKKCKPFLARLRKKSIAMHVKMSIT